MVCFYVLIFKKNCLLNAHNLGSARIFLKFMVSVFLISNTYTHTHNQPHIFVRSFTQVHLAQRVKATLEPFLSVIRSQTWFAMYGKGAKGKRERFMVYDV